ncbi:MAG: hypothetical protein OXI88_22530 [Gammaproteobacteria bacterium]|nr:hypothetical protein [Gammaproteobacteria bacterium]MDE0514545.1 hypothetical protein [Gammaproteobacteria bacterium]
MALELTTEQRAALPRNSKILVAMWEAEDQGNTEEADRLFSALDIPAHTLMAIKTVLGADWIRSRNLRTHLAEEKYGPDWLDAPEGEAVAGTKSAG